MSISSRNSITLTLSSGQISLCVDYKDINQNESKLYLIIRFVCDSYIVIVTAAAWRNMVDQDLDDVAFLADTDKAREARELREAPVAVCSQRRALCLTLLIFAAIFASALLIVYATPQPYCPCASEATLVDGQTPTDASNSEAASNKERIASNGAVFPWRGARLPTFVLPRHYSLWLHPNLTTGELRGEVSIDLRVERDTSFVVLNVRDMNVTERALFKCGAVGPKVAKVLEYTPAEQTYIEFKEKLRRKYNYTLSLRFITRLERNDKLRGFFLTGTHRQRCAVSRFWLTHARSVFPCFDEPHFRATFKLTIVRDRFHVSLTNMPIVATEEAGFYLGHRLLQDEFSPSPPMAPHMISVAVCRLQRKAAPPINETELAEDEDQPEISLYSDKKGVLEEAEPLLEWVQKTLQMFAYELNTSYPLPKFDIVVVDGGNPYSEGWGLITLSPSSLTDTKTIARLLAQQWFGGVVSPRWWSSQWLLDALTSVMSERAPPLAGPARPPPDNLLLDHVLPALRLDSSNSVRAVASPRLERADIESSTDELSLHKGAAIVSMAIEAAGEAAGRAALARLLRDHKSASADARDLWRALDRHKGEAAHAHAWDGWCEKPGYPLLYATGVGSDVVLRQERFVMSADPPDPDPPVSNDLLTMDLRADLDELFYEPENYTETEDDFNVTTTTPTTTTAKATTTPAKASSFKWMIPVTFKAGPLHEVYAVPNDTHRNTTWYDVGNETKPALGSRWKENETNLIWMNDTEMTIPDLGKHKWVMYNVGARGLYRVAPLDRRDGESAESAALLAATMFEQASPAEKALMLDDAFVLSRAGRLPASRAIAAAGRIRFTNEWSSWRVVTSHLSWWRGLLARRASGPRLLEFLAELYTQHNVSMGSEDSAVSGALLSAGVEWGNKAVTQKALDVFDGWFDKNETIPDVYQEGALTAGVRARGEEAWRRCWVTLRECHTNPRADCNRHALLIALSSPADDWLFYKFAFTTLSMEAQRNREWSLWVTALYTSACKWRGSAGVWSILRPKPVLPPPALLEAARCMGQAQDYYKFKTMFAGQKGVQAALDVIALNVAWADRADADIGRYFEVLELHQKRGLNLTSS